MNLTRDEAEQDFKNGKCAMYYNGSWVAASLDDENCPVKGKILVRNFASFKASADELRLCACMGYIFAWIRGPDTY